IFEPQVAPSGPVPNLVTLFGSVDAPYTILRVARRHGTCQGGANAGQLCTVGLDCPGGTCPTTCVGAPSTRCTTDAQSPPSRRCRKLFDLSFVANAGPLVLPRDFISPGICQDSKLTCSATPCAGADPCVNYALEAQSPVALESLAVSTSSVRAFTAKESIDIQ